MRRVGVVCPPKVAEDTPREPHGSDIRERQAPPPKRPRPQKAPPPQAGCCAHLDDANGGGIDGGGLWEVVQVVDPHGQDLEVSTEP